MAKRAAGKKSKPRSRVVIVTPRKRKTAAPRGFRGCPFALFWTAAAGVKPPVSKPADEPAAAAPAAAPAVPPPAAPATK